MTEAYRVDANVIVRFLTGEPDEMAKCAKALMKRADRGEVDLIISVLIVAETYWVLHSYYEFSRSQIRDVLSQFVQARGITTQSRELVEEALDRSAENNVDFVDAILSLRAEQNGETVATFDQNDFDKFPSEWINLSETIE